MPAAFSGKRPGLRLLLLLCLSLSGGSPADPTVTTQDASHSQANSLTKMQTGLNVSSPEGTEVNIPSRPSKATTRACCKHLKDRKKLFNCQLCDLLPLCIYTMKAGNDPGDGITPKLEPLWEVWFWNFYLIIFHMMTPYAFL